MRYKQNEGLPQPRIRAVKVNVDIYPDLRTLRAHGRYELINKTDQPISTVLVNLPLEVTIHRLLLGADQRPTDQDQHHGIYTFQLPEAVAPGEELSLEFDLEYAPKGFENNRADTRVVHNGTFFNHRNLPRLGYLASQQLSGNRKRRKHGLKPVERMAKIDDLAARYNTYISSGADWIDFDATVSTSADQIAVAPGSLQWRIAH